MGVGELTLIADWQYAGYSVKAALTVLSLEEVEQEAYARDVEKALKEQVEG